MVNNSVLKIEDEAIDRLRRYCKKQGLIMKVFVSRLINKYLNDRNFEK